MKGNLENTKMVSKRENSYRGNEEISG
jgi:hypothetical protein